MIAEEFLKIGEFAASGAFEEPERSLFYRKSLGIRRYYENCSLYPYRKGKIYPSGSRDETMTVYPHYLRGLQLDESRIRAEDRERMEVFRKDFCRFHSQIPKDHTVAGDMYCHSIPHYARILREGLDSYADRIRRIPEGDLRDGLLHVYEGIRTYVFRCTEYLKAEHAEESLIRALEKVPLGKAETVYEAIVSWNFILYLDNCDNLGCLATDLREYWHGEDITDLLENLYDNLDDNNGYSMALHTGDDVGLVCQCLRTAKGKRRPMIELFVDDNTPQAVWDEAWDLVQSHGGQPAFYNPGSLLGGIQHRFGIPEQDIRRFCGGGCTESMIAGYSNVGSLDAGVHLLLILEKCIYRDLSVCRTFEDFYHFYIKEVTGVLDEVTEKISLAQKERAEFLPLPMRTFLVDDCIDTATEYNAGGARYSWSIVNFAGMINVIDAMLVIRRWVYEEHRYDAADFCRYLKNNDAAFLAECRRCDLAFGRGNVEADAFAHRISEDIYSYLGKKKPYLGQGFLPASIQFMSQAAAGKKVGATPDGRAAWEPLCDSLGAIFRKDIEGPTALLRSVASLAQNLALGVPVLNFNIDETWGKDALKAMILSYMAMGGIQMQITCVGADVLKDACVHPENYPNLIVRVGGFSEYFGRLSEDTRRMIRDRSIQESRRR